MKKGLFHILLFVSLLAESFAQDIHFSQYYNSPLQLNPAHAGGFGKVQAILNYKDQWKSVAGVPFRTYAGSVDFQVTKKKWRTGYMGVGLMFFSDKAGDGAMGTTHGSVSVASFRKLDRKNSLSAGLQFGFTQRSVNFSAFTWDTQFDGMNYNASYPTGEGVSGAGKFLIMDVGLGAVWNFDKGEQYTTANNGLKAKAGFSVFHLNRPYYSFLGSGSERQYMKFVVHSSTAIGIKNTLGTVIPTLVVFKQGPLKEITFGGLYKIILVRDSKITGYIKSSYLYFGGHYRWRDSFIASMHFDVGNWGLGFSYDINVSKLRIASTFRGGFEVSLRFHTLDDYMFSPSSRF
ncbi:MAG: PorP/SprF family type IX secretion system membrane protein [Bacteroidota bacterium]